MQEALIAAVAQWPRDGIPENPRGWLMQVAQRKMADHLRSEVARRNRESAVAMTTPLAVAPESVLHVLYLVFNEGYTDQLGRRAPSRRPLERGHSTRAGDAEAHAASRRRRWTRLDAVRAHLLERAGDRVAAVALYRKAASRTASVPERNYLTMKAARLIE